MAASAAAAAWAPLLLLLAASGCCTAIAGASDSPSGSLTITEMRRAIDLTTSVARTTTTLTVRNDGAAEASSVLIAAGSTHRVAYLSFERVDGRGVLLGYSKRQGGDAVPPGYELYAVDVSVPAGGGTVELVAYVACVEAMVARPAEISQGEPQFVDYIDQLYIPSPYAVSGTQLTEIVLPTAAAPRRYPAPQHAALDGNILTYGPFHATPAWAVRSEAAADSGGSSDSEGGGGSAAAAAAAGKLWLNFEHNAPFFRIRALTRTVELSHWAGRLAVEDRYEDLLHSGARLRGGWSRLDYSRRSASAWQSPAGGGGGGGGGESGSSGGGGREDGTISSLSVRVPAHALGSVFFRDELGNVSTSYIHTAAGADTGHATAKKKEEEKEEKEQEGEVLVSLVLSPRYPLIGGWKTSFETGYTAPLAEYLRVSSSSSREALAQL